MRGLIVAICCLFAINLATADDARPRKIVLIAGKKSHGPGAHDYERTMRLFKVMLDNSNVADRMRVEVHEKGWPDDEKTLDDADTIVFYSDGRDGDKFTDAPFVLGNRMEVIQKQIDRGCGFMTMHFSTFVTDKQGEKVLDWVGGYFDWEGDEGKRDWYSKISQVETLELASRDHAISRGVPRMLQIRDEVYWKLRFKPGDKRLTPIWKALDVKDDDKSPQVNTVGWTIERPDGGRGFGTSVGHGYRLWSDDGMRKLFLNAIVWTARAEVPEGGVEAKFYTDDQVKEALTGVRGMEQAKVLPPLRVLLFTGNEAHAWHNGEKSTLAVKAALESGGIEVEVSKNINDLGKLDLAPYSAILLNNYCNWHDPKGIDAPSREAFLKYLKSGGGLVVVHFANGAFHYSLPMAAESDWPEYRKIVRRVWDHQGQGESKSGHDAFGKFAVQIKGEHPIVAGLKPFEVTDELYYRQAGDEPIEPLITATSKDTKREEPLAWAYDYDKARVFQTLLGHSEQTYEAYEAREMLRRAVAWVARREVKPLPAENEKSVAAKSPSVSFADGRFGKALNAKQSGILLHTKAENADQPLTVECWTKLDSRQGFNILVASEEKTSPTHWELYSYAGSGVCSVYLPGRGGEFKSEIDIADGKWHHVGFSLEAERIRLFVDGKQALDRPITKLDQKAAKGSIAIGRLVEGTISCDGLIDDVHISRGAHPLDDLPKHPHQRRDDTLLLLPLDDVAELAKLQARASVPRPAVSGSQGNHWGEEAIGIRWKEEDSRDDRWKDADIGRFLASSLPLGSQHGTVAKGLSIRLGDKQEATVCYDTTNMKLRAAWTGGFLKFTPARYGLIMPPLVDGDPLFLASESPGWEGKVQYRELRKYNDRVVLKYTVDDAVIDESPWIDSVDGQTVVLRTFRVAPTKRPLVLKVAAKADGQVEIRPIHGGFVGTVTSGDNACVFQYQGPDGPRWNIANEELQLVIPTLEKETSFQLGMIAKSSRDLGSFKKLLPAKVTKWADIQKRSSKSHPPIETRGKIGEPSGAYAVDTITIPFDNPYKALFFTSGHDVIPGDGGKQGLAVCTVHGDVWIVTGVDDKLEKLSWRRYATGLFQPLGLVCKRDGIYVLGRDQITRLQDVNYDGEADTYECFSNAMPTSPGGHDYTTCLETDEEGNFYFITAREGVWRLSADGTQLENLAGGLRNPNGLGVGPGPIITASPQEGNWTPATYIAEVKPGDYFGYGGPKVTPERPFGWTQPLCFIPRRRDNSSGGQVWVTSDRWGPLAGQLIHFSYGQCRMMLVPREVINGQPQGGTVEMPPIFESGAMRGRFSPYDGQLYVSGLRGWTTAATQDGCLQRVRYTSKPVNLPVKVRTLKNGLAITFSDPLNQESAEDAGNYHLEQWNYRYAESYGSPDFKVSDPKQEGHDPVRIESATLLDDNKTVFLEINDLKPVHQLSIGFALQAASGDEVRNSMVYTIHNVGSEAMNRDLLNQTSIPGRLSEAEEKALRPGLAASVTLGEMHDSFVARTAVVSAYDGWGGHETREFLLESRLEGYLQVPLRGKYTFASQGKARLYINESEVKDLSAEETSSRFEPVELRGGFNKIAVVCTPTRRTYRIPLRLTWSQGDSPQEPISQTFLFHNGESPLLGRSRSISLGRKLFKDHQCLRCHSESNLGWVGGIHSPPMIEGGNKQLTREWLAQWILNPEQTRNHATMPQQFDAKNEKDRKAVADLVAYLTADAPKNEAEAAPSDEQVTAGRELYENLGCIACHKLTPPESDDEFKRISLYYTSAKFRPGKLKEYLLSPHKDHSTSRMPDFKLSQQEAETLAAYLRVASEGKLEPLVELTQGDQESGEKLFESRRCINCHTRSQAKPVHTPLTKLHHGCLTNDPGNRRGAPLWHFAETELNALRAFIEQKQKGLDIPYLPTRQSQELYQDLRCNACHKRDGVQGDRLAILADESEDGRTPELLPDLTWAGEKLHRDWAEKQIAGKIEYRTRPWLKARMPAFPAYAEALAKGMEAEHAPSSSQGETPSEESIKIGEQLTLKENLDCRQCHGIGNLEPMGDDKTKLAPGINFGHIRERLRHDYYRRFVLDPPKWDVSTRMPKLAVDGRTTKVTSFYDGDAAKQFEAIWHYLHTAKKPSEMPPAE